MLSKNGGRRVYMTDAGMSAGGYEFFAGLEKYFTDLRKTTGVLKYQLSREVPGLEVVMESEDLHAATVWKSGADLRVVASETAVRDKVKQEIEDLDEDGAQPPTDQYVETTAKKQALREKTMYQGYSWYKITDGKVDGISSQPPEAEYIPMRDGLAVQPSDEQWKARAGGVEIRTSAEGIFKVIRGNLTKFRTGDYRDAVITPSGRWAVVRKTDNEIGGHIVRVDLTTGKEFNVEMEGYGERKPLAFIASLNKVLVIRDDNAYADNEYYPGAEDNDLAPIDADPEGMILVDPATGAVQPIAGEFRPLAQQTFRPLQKTAKPNEYWAAIVDEEKSATEIGIYDTKTFGFKTLLRVPKIKFNSMQMWVDEPAKKVYFVYRGHLLALPLTK